MRTLAILILAGGVWAITEAVTAMLTPEVRGLIALLVGLVLSA